MVANFIEEALEEGGVVLVNCLMGVNQFFVRILGLLVKPVHAGVSKCYLCSRLPLLKAGDEYRTGRDNSKYFSIFQASLLFIEQKNRKNCESYQSQIT